MLALQGAGTLESLLDTIFAQYYHDVQLMYMKMR